MSTVRHGARGQRGPEPSTGTSGCPAPGAGQVAGAWPAPSKGQALLLDLAAWLQEKNLAISFTTHQAGLAPSSVRRRWDLEEEGYGNE